MDRARVAELHFIAPFVNLRSIGELGILSHARAQSVWHTSVALEEVQDRRVGKYVPGGRPLHEYANTYFHARNPMISRRRNQRLELAVVRVHPSVLELPNVVVTDGNAASNSTRFYPSPEGIAALDEDRVYAEWWTDPDMWTYYEKKRQRCAEVLVPDNIPAEYLTGAYVCHRDGVAICEEALPGLEVVVNAHVFLA